MRKFALPNSFLFILIVTLCITPLLVNVQAENWRWTKVPSPTNAYLQSVNMVNATDGWAVGFDGTIIHWDGINWKKIDSPTNANLKAIDMVNSNEGWAIAGDISGWGNNNSIVKWDGIKWENLSEPTSARSLRHAILNRRVGSRTSRNHITLGRNKLDSA